MVHEDVIGGLACAVIIISQKSENLHFDGLLLSKTYKVLDEKVQKSYALWHWKVMQSLKKNWLLVPLKNNAKSEEVLTCTLKHDVRKLAIFEATLKICTLMGFSWQKCITFELNKYRGVIRHYTEDRCKLWRKNDLRLHIWHDEFGEFHWSTQRS